MPDRCHPGVTLGILYSEWILVQSSEIVKVEWNWDIRVESSVEWIALHEDFSRYLLFIFVGLGLLHSVLGKGM
jgi:hypothetical protein